MKDASKLPVSPTFTFLAVLLVGYFAVLTSGCGAGTTKAVLPSGSTTVTVMLSSTANDQLAQYNAEFTSITLTSGDKSSTLLSAEQSPEFIHLNGTAEPLVTVSIPQGIYTGATATIAYASDVCIFLSSGTLNIHNFGYGHTATVNVPYPITITGTAMGLLLDLEVLQSASYSACLTGSAFTTTATFNLTSFAISPQPTNPENGKASGIDGLISSIDSSGLGMLTLDGIKLALSTSAGTEYQGVSGPSGLAAGMAVDVDAALQTNGSLLATRVAVEDANPNNLSAWTGPVLNVDSLVPVLGDQARDAQGYLQNPGYYDSFGTATFQTSGQFSNLQSLPFTASFNGRNIVAGQNVYITSHAVTFAPEPIYLPAATVTLIPQTINGTVSAVGNEGSFSTYTVTLAPYDFFPALAVQPGQTTVLTNPNQVVVYVDSNTQQLNTTSLTVGSVLRFNGLVFNDKGTLRMDCAQVNDGVAE
jgi:Domain of unknown function (DUF5666)